MEIDHKYPHKYLILKIILTFLNFGNLLIIITEIKLEGIYSVT
jgi:hypothetical protein